MMEVAELVAYCTQDDVENRLRRPLTTTEINYLDSLIEEAQVLVEGYLRCPPGAYPEPDDVPAAVRVVVSRMVARVITQEANTPAELLGATQIGETAGPFSSQVSFGQPRFGSPWLQKSDRESLSPFRCASKAFSIDTAPGRGTVHAEGCSAINYLGLPGNYWAAYCTCGAYLAGAPNSEVG